jgi:hypothetical protein
MKATKQVDGQDAAVLESADADELLPLLERERAAVSPAAAGVVVGKLLAIAEQGRVPIVAYAGQPTTAAVGARSIIDLHAAHIGCHVVLAFENGDATKPIVVGVLRKEGWPAEKRPEEVEVDADGSRLIVTAREQLVLRCGQASITLKKDGEVTIKGTRLSSHSSGVNRIKGGSVELN